MLFGESIVDTVVFQSPPIITGVVPHLSINPPRQLKNSLALLLGPYIEMIQNSQPEIDTLMPKIFSCASLKLSVMVYVIDLFIKIPTPLRFVDE
jgi:hypothetical protein